MMRPSTTECTNLLSCLSIIFVSTKNEIFSHTVAELFYSGLDHCNSHGRSVCPSVRPSRSGVLARQMKIQSCGFPYQVVQSF